MLTSSMQPIRTSVLSHHRALVSQHSFLRGSGVAGKPDHCCTTADHRLAPDPYLHRKLLRVRVSRHLQCLRQITMHALPKIWGTYAVRGTMNTVLLLPPCCRCSYVASDPCVMVSPCLVLCDMGRLTWYISFLPMDLAFPSGFSSPQITQSKRVIFGEITGHDWLDTHGVQAREPFQKFEPR